MSAQNDEAPAGDAAQRFGDTQEDLDPIVANQTGLDKSRATLAAELARRGFALLELSDGFLIGRWGWSKIAPDLRAVGAFLRQIGGAK